MNAVPAVLLADLAAPALAARVLAHLTPTGLGPWGDGMARLLLQPTDLLLVLALQLLAAQAGRACSDRLPLLLPAAWLLGGLAGLALPGIDGALALPLTAAVLAVGVLVALAVRLRPPTVLRLGAGLVLVAALAAGSALLGHPGALPALLGEGVAIAVLTVLLAPPLAPPHPPALGIALRVIGSWIAAAALLMLGWQLRHPG